METETIIPEYFLLGADRFAKNYKDMNTGTYFIGDDSDGARVGNTSGNIEIDKSKLVSNEKYNSNFVYFMLLWCYAKKRDLYGSDYSADKIALTQYLKENRSKKELMIALREFFEKANTEHNMDRLKKIVAIIDDEKTEK